MRTAGYAVNGANDANDEDGDPEPLVDVDQRDVSSVPMLPTILPPVPLVAPALIHASTDAPMPTPEQLILATQTTPEQSIWPLRLKVGGVTPRGSNGKVSLTV